MCFSFKFNLHAIRMINSCLKCAIKFLSVFGFNIFIFKNFYTNELKNKPTFKDLSLCHNHRFFIPLSLQPDVVDLRNFKLGLLDLT